MVGGEVGWKGVQGQVKAFHHLGLVGYVQLLWQPATDRHEPEPSTLVVHLA